MTTTTKQIIATIIVTACGYATSCGLINIISRTVETPSTHWTLCLIIVAWVTILSIWMLSRALIELRDSSQITNHKSQIPKVLYTDRELATRDRSNLSDQDKHQESLKRKYAIRD